MYRKGICLFRNIKNCFICVFSPESVWLVSVAVKVGTSGKM